MTTTTITRRRRFAPIAAAMAASALILSACSGGTSTETPASGQSAESGSVEPSGAFDSGNATYDEVVNLGPVADEATIAASEWATKVKESGVLRVGGTETSDLFSKLQDPVTGKVIGFDAGMSQLLARYIFGDAIKTSLTQVSVDTREELLVNGQVDVVIATYSITP